MFLYEKNKELYTVIDNVEVQLTKGMVPLKGNGVLYTDEELNLMFNETWYGKIILWVKNCFGVK